MKKVAILVFFGLLASLYGQPTVTAPNQVNQPGTVVAPINVSNFSNIGSFTLRIQFNPSVLTFQSVANWHTQVAANALGGAQNGVVSLVWSATTPANIANDKLVDINFTYNGGTTGLTFVLAQCEVTDAVGNPLTVTYVNGSIGVTPVELLSFESEYSGDHIKLRWATATETNNKGFEIHRSVNGQDWQAMGFVEGKGTTTEKQYYSFTDKKVSVQGEHRYKLIQSDFDGTREVVGELIVDVSSLVEDYGLFQNYPNPFNPTTTIDYAIPQEGYVSLKIYSPDGNEVANLVSESKKAGLHSIQFQASGLPSGVYFYKLEAGTKTIVKKLMLLK